MSHLQLGKANSPFERPAAFVQARVPTAGVAGYMKGRGHCLPSEPNSSWIDGGLSASSALNGKRQKQLKDLLELIGVICESRAGMIHLLSDEYRASIGDGGQMDVEAPLDACFCSHTTPQQGLFVVTDLQDDPRFCDHSLVTREPYFRFYASYPLTTSSDERIGILCLCGHAPRQLTAEQQEALCSISRHVVL